MKQAFVTPSVTASTLAPDTETAQRVLRAQVSALYATTWSSTLADTLLAWALCAVYYWRLREPMVLVWLGLHLVQLLRYPMFSAYHRDPQAAGRSEFWARRHGRELLFYSSIWGLAPWLFMPVDNLPLTTLMMLVMLGLASAGIPSVVPSWRSVLSFVVPMLTGLITALAWRADLTHLFLATCSALYLGATLHFARQQHRQLTETLLMRFEKEALAEQLARQMAVTQKVSEEKTRFFASASHDLRQPLHAIALFGAVMEKELQGQPQHTNATRLMRAVNALGTSLDTMLDVSRLDAGVILPALQPVALNPVFQSLNQVFASFADEKGLQLRLRASPLWVRTDPHLLQRLLANLIENAIKYTPQGGVLVVARARQTVPDAQVWIDVIDTGVGIAPEHRDLIFQEFYQVDNPGRDRSQGLGIGLSIVRRLSALLAHPIELHSLQGRGSRFRLKLPLAGAPEPALSKAPAGDTQQAPAPGANPAPAPTLPARVLLIDDETDIGDAMTALLNAHGIHVTTARDEAQAVAAFSNAANHDNPSSAGSTARFDALLCDYRLAGGADGLALGLRLRQRFSPGLPLLLVTGETSPQRLQTVRDAKVPVLFKPVSAETLLAALAALR